MNIESLSIFSTRKHQLNQLCASAVEQQISQNKAEDTHRRNRRRYLAKQVLKHQPLKSSISSQRWLHAVTLVFAMWGFNDLVIPNQALAAGEFADAVGPLPAFNLSYNSTPVFADVDGDGDFDMFVGEYDGTVRYYRNTEIDTVAQGTGFVADTAGNPLTGIDVGAGAAPTFADIDGDGDLDAFIGEVTGTVKYYRNTEIDTVAQGTGFVADIGGNPLVSQDVGDYSKPTFADIDGDGDLDAFIGESTGIVKYYRNTEIDTVAQGTGFVADAVANPLSAVSVAGYAAPTFVDIDADGDLDAFIGEYNGTTVKYYRNTEIDDVAQGTGFVADATGNPLKGFEVVVPSGYSAGVAPAFVNIDGDGDFDVFVGTYSGAVLFSRNTGTDVAPSFSPDHPLSLVDYNHRLKPTFADVDGDGDLDAFVGARNGQIKYYRNTEIDTVAQGTGFVSDNGGNIGFSGVSASANAALAFADIDGDGDLDLFIGDFFGLISYYRNTEIDTVAQGSGFVADATNTLHGIDVGDRAVPSFADIDGDGDLDAFIGEDSGTVKYYRNTEIDTVAQGTGFVADVAGNPLAVVSLSGAYGYAAPAFADIDDDGDLDAFVGEYYGSIKYYRNTEIDTVAQGTGFVADDAGNPVRGNTVSNQAAPAFADLDGDGDLDLFVGQNGPKITFVENRPSTSAAATVGTGATATGSSGNGFLGLGGLSYWSLLLLPLVNRLRRKKA